MANPFWSEAIPVWVSRKTSTGLISAFSVPGWLFMLLGCLLLLNALGWAVYGAVELVLKVIGLF